MGILHSISKTKRKNKHQVSENIIYRWSPRSMSDKPIKEQELNPLFEAARWAPSSRNNQEWEYIYSLKKDDSFKIFYDTLYQGNKEWAQNASVIVALISRKQSKYKDKPIRTHSLDAGMSLQNFLIEATKRDFVAHPIGGFDLDKLKKYLKIPEHKQIECLVILGRPADKSKLNSEDMTQRNKIDNFVTHKKT